jgi:hypothetical protein
LPKGDWDVDEMKEECAMRETYEEGYRTGDSNMVMLFIM